MKHRAISEKERLTHRDLSWLSFNERVLEEALDASNPLLERGRFLAIFVNNLDEFFMVRVANIKRLIESEINKKDRFGYYPQELMGEVKKKVGELTAKLYQIYCGKILPELEQEGIHIKKVDDLKGDRRKFIKNYFETTLFPILTPMAIDPGHPFPFLPSKTMAFAVNLKRKGEDHFAIIPVPGNIPRIINLPTQKHEYNFVLAEDVIRFHLSDLFKGYRIKACALFRLIRDSELSADEEDAEDLLKMILEEVRKRVRSQTVYLELEQSCPEDLKGWLAEGLSLPAEEFHLLAHHFDLRLLFELVGKVDKPALLFPRLPPTKIPYENIFDRIKEGDFLTHLPFHSFYPATDLIRAAAWDENVLAIKMTLYRVNRDSAIVKALMDAAQNKKQVTVLVEIKARFDEENNIRWVKELENSGCHVIYGIPGLKIHSKMALVVRREETDIRRYVHLSTGNYNEHTAKIYTDMGYFTANEDFAKDVSELFNVVTGYSVPMPWTRVVSSPNDLRDYFFALIDNEIKTQRKNKNGAITVKINSLEDVKMIDKLYQASEAGVKIRLIVRGICCLVPGVKGLSQNIKVKSIVGRYLEHTRVFFFNNNGSPRIFLSSADWMTRNLDRRIEILFEVTKEDLKGHLKDVLDFYWKDTAKARVLQPDRTYQRALSEGEKINAQEHLIGFYRAV